MALNHAKPQSTRSRHGLLDALPHGAQAAAGAGRWPSAKSRTAWTGRSPALLHRGCPRFWSPLATAQRFGALEEGCLDSFCFLLSALLGVRQVVTWRLPPQIWVVTFQQGPTIIGVCDDSGEDPTCHNSVCYLGLCTSIADHMEYLGAHMYHRRVSKPTACSQV